MMKTWGKTQNDDGNPRMISQLAEKGYRMTPQRLLIVSTVEDAVGHASAEEIFAQVVQKYPNVNISTVYRTLDLLEEQGMVTKTDLGDGSIRYHPAHKGHHHHLVCRDCGKIIDLDGLILEELKQHLFSEYEFIADLQHLGIRGRCLKCHRKINTAVAAK